MAYMGLVQRSQRNIIPERDVLLFAAGMLSAIFYFAVLQRPIAAGGEPLAITQSIVKPEPLLLPSAVPRVETVAIAESIVRHGRFADPFAANGPSGPTAHLAPLLPLFFAACYLLLGKAVAFALILCAAVVAGVHAALLPRFSQQALASARPGMIAAVCVIALPLLPLEPMWENMYSAAALLAFCLAFRHLNGIAGGIRCGLAAGLLILLNPALVVVIACWLGFVLCRRGSFLPIAATVLTALLAILPWEIRNYVQLGGFTFVRDNFGLELYAANNDCAQPSLLENLHNGCYEQKHPMFSAAELQRLRAAGELNYNLGCARRALQWIRTHQRRFWQLVKDRVVYFWFPPGKWLTGIITGLSCIGLALALQRQPRLAAFAVSVFALYPLPYYVVQSSERFRYPIMWMTLILAGYAVTCLIRNVEKATGSSNRVALGWI